MSKVARFNQIWLPARKLRAQRAIERMTGREEARPNAFFSPYDVVRSNPPRRERISPEQAWADVWPAAASYRWSTVPLPLRMGWVRKTELRPPPRAKGNLELAKIPNFLHLTPPAIQRHCLAIKKFCTPFPPELLSEPKLVNVHLPLVLSYDDYVHQGTNIRDARARVVTLRFKVSDLGGLDTHARRKLIQLLGERYDEQTDTATILADRCPTRKQNRDYAHYLLTALYHESMKEEGWEGTASRRSGDDILPVHESGYRVPLDVESYKREAMERLGLTPPTSKTDVEKVSAESGASPVAT